MLSSSSSSSSFVRCCLSLSFRRGGYVNRHFRSNNNNNKINTIVSKQQQQQKESLPYSSTSIISSSTVLHRNDQQRTLSQSVIKQQQQQQHDEHSIHNNNNRLSSLLRQSPLSYHASTTIGTLSQAVELQKGIINSSNKSQYFSTLLRTRMDSILSSSTVNIVPRIPNNNNNTIHQNIVLLDQYTSKRTFASKRVCTKYICISKYPCLLLLSVFS
jgi:hypothetical protein